MIIFGLSICMVSVKALLPQPLASIVCLPAHQGRFALCYLLSSGREACIGDDGFRRKGVFRRYTPKVVDVSLVRAVTERLAAGNEEEEEEEEEEAKGYDACSQ